MTDKEKIFYDKMTISMMSNIDVSLNIPIAIKLDLKNISRDIYKNGIISLSLYNKYIDWLENVSIEKLSDLLEEFLYYNNNKFEMINDFINGLLSEDEIKQNGVVLTPSWLAKLLIDKTIGHWENINEHNYPKVICDSSCGMGIFIEGLKNRFETSYLKGIDINQKFVDLLNDL